MIQHAPFARAALPMFMLAILALWATLYLINPPLYLHLLGYWWFAPKRPPFLDTAHLTAQIRCWAQGVDVYRADPCDAMGERFTYAPLWLRLRWLGLGAGGTLALGMAQAILFALSLALLPPARSRGGAMMLRLALLSPVTFFALERGNPDLLMFSLAAAATALLRRGPLAAWCGYAAILLAGMLKFYPLVLLAWVARENRRHALCVLGSIAVLLLAMLIGWGGEMLRALHNLPHPSPFGDGFGAGQIYRGAAFLLGLPAPTLLLHPALAILAGLAAWRLARSARFAAACATLSPDEAACLLTGALLTCGCFFAGASVGYRAIMLLFALPGLMVLAQKRHALRATRPAAILVLAALWALAPLAWFGPFGTAALFVGPLPFFILWLVHEVLWWWLVCVLLAAIMHLIGRAPMR